MSTLMQYVGATLTCPKQLKLEPFSSRARCSAEVGVSTCQFQQQLDKELANGDDRTALALVMDSQGNPSGLRCFGAARSFYGSDTFGHTFSQKYHDTVIQVRFGYPSHHHEAGHFLIAYLIGILPKGYTLTSLDALKKKGSLNVQAGTAFVDFEFVEVNAGKVSATILNRFSCIALAGVATEYLIYGIAEGGLDDKRKLDSLLKSLGFTQKKSDSQVRWSVLNTVLLRRRHEGARAKLAKAMSLGKSVGSCIGAIENFIDVSDI